MSADKNAHPYYSQSERAIRRAIEEHVASLPDGPEKEAQELHLSALLASNREIDRLTEISHLPATLRGRAEELLRGRQRVEQMYINELRLQGRSDGSVENMILDVLYACFLARYTEDERAREFFAPYAQEKKKKETARTKKGSSRPRGYLTNKKLFVRAFLESKQTKYAFAKRVARINAALPAGKRFGCNSTTPADVETQLDRAIDQWGDIVRKQMSLGQK